MVRWRMRIIGRVARAKSVNTKSAVVGLVVICNGYELGIE